MNMKIGRYNVKYKIASVDKKNNDKQIEETGNWYERLRISNQYVGGISLPIHCEWDEITAEVISAPHKSMIGEKISIANLPNPLNDKSLRKVLDRKYKYSFRDKENKFYIKNLVGRII